MHTFMLVSIQPHCEAALESLETAIGVLTTSEWSQNVLIFLSFNGKYSVKFCSGWKEICTILIGMVSSNHTSTNIKVQIFNMCSS